MITSVQLQGKKLRINLDEASSYSRAIEDLRTLASQRGLNLTPLEYNHGVFGRVRIMSFTQGQGEVIAIAHLKKVPYWNPVDSGTYYLSPGKSENDLGRLAKILSTA